MLAEPGVQVPVSGAVDGHLEDGEPGRLLPERRDELFAALAQEPSGLTVLEVPVDRSTHRDLHARLRERAAAALRA